MTVTAPHPDPTGAGSCLLVALKALLSACEHLGDVGPAYAACDDARAAIQSAETVGIGVGVGQ